MKERQLSLQYMIVIATAIVISTYIGLFYVGYNGAAAVFWPAAGFYVAFYYLYKKEALPIILVAYFIANFVYRIFLVDESIWVSFAITISFIIGSYTVMTLFTVFTEKLNMLPEKLYELKHGIKLSIATLAATIIAGIIPLIAFIIFYGTDDIVIFYIRWIVGDFLGVIVFASLLFSAYYSDPTLKAGLINILNSTIHVVAYIAILIFVFGRSGNDFITMENFQIAIIMMYVIAAFAFSYRMIIFNNIMFLVVAFVLDVGTKPPDEANLEIVMLCLYVVALSSIASVIRNVLLERKKNFDQLEESKKNLETTIISINNMFNVQNRIPGEVDHFSTSYLHDMFRLACNIYPKFSSASCYIKGEDSVTFIATLGYDTHELNQFRFDPEIFKWSFYTPEIVYENDNKAALSKSGTHSEYVEKYGYIKESIRLTIDIGEGQVGGMSFDISVGETERFDQSDIESFTTFQTVVNSYFMIGMLNTQNNSLKDDIVRSSVRTLELYDSYTGSHSEEVSQLSLEIGRELHLADEDLRQLYWAALVHDIGKIGVPADVVNKPTPLSDEEYELVKQHSTFGYDILARSSGLQTIAKTVKHHHEWWNGKGYPDGIRAMEIPYASQIIHVCDAVSAMSSDRVYQSKLSLENIVEQLQNGLGKQFSPKVCKFMIKYIESGKYTTFLRKIRKEDV